MFSVVCRPRWLARWPSLLRLPIKLILQAFSLLWMMFVAMPPPEAILLQVGCAWIWCCEAARSHKPESTRSCEDVIKT